MKKSLLLSAALALVVGPMPLVVAHAQSDAQSTTTETSKKKPKRTFSRGTEFRREKPTEEEGATDAQPKKPPMFPNATRVEPKPGGAQSLQNQLNALIELQNKEGSEDDSMAKADAILADAKATPYDKSLAGYLAGAAAQGKDGDTYKTTIKYFRGAINDNGLDNNLHYQLMLQQAQMLAADEQYPEALSMAERFLSETKSEDPRAYNVKAQILLATDKPDAAAAELERVLATKPGDKAMMMNLLSLYAQAGNDAKAVQMIEKLRTGGMFTESKDYDMAFRMLANMDGHEKDALAMIDEGLKKGILEPSSAVYSFQGSAFYDADKIPQAIEAWNKGGALAKDGELYLNVAKLQVQTDHWADAKTAAQNALAKGMKKPGEAWQVIATSERGLGNKAAARAAIQEAAKYPETKKWAESALRQASGK